MITTGTRHLKDITDAELTTLVELSGEWGVYQGLARYSL